MARLGHSMIWSGALLLLVPLGMALIVIGVVLYGRRHGSKPEGPDDLR
jgi:uncharacterized membrane protein